MARSQVPRKQTIQTQQSTRTLCCTTMQHINILSQDLKRLTMKSLVNNGQSYDFEDSKPNLEDFQTASFHREARHSQASEVELADFIKMEHNIFNEKQNQQQFSSGYSMDSDDAGSLPRSLESKDINFYLKNLMVPKVMKISVANTQFQKVIFVLAMKFFTKSKYDENFIFEWLDLKTSEMEHFTGQMPKVIAQSEPEEQQIVTQPSLVKASVESSPENVVLTKQEIIDSVSEILDSFIKEKAKDYREVSEIENVTMFHAKKLAPITIQKYLTRFATHSSCHEDTFIYALIYLDRIGENIEDFSLDSFNCLRIILLSLVTSIKFYDDNYYTNKYYAQIGGVSAEEFNRLETEFLCNYLDFSLYVDVDTYASYYNDLIKFTQDKRQQKGAQ